MSVAEELATMPLKDKVAGTDPTAFRAAIFCCPVTNKQFIDWSPTPSTVLTATKQAA